MQEIQVEAGPQDGTLLVTWQPVNRPPSSGPVTGYAVYADGKKVSFFVRLETLQNLCMTEKYGKCCEVLL